jgi:hypothetical protein
MKVAAEQRIAWFNGIKELSQKKGEKKKINEHDKKKEMIYLRLDGTPLEKNPKKKSKES